MPNYPVYEVIDLARKQVIYYVDQNTMYVCTPDSPNRTRAEYKWQIKKIVNSNDGNFPYEQTIIFAEGNDGFVFAQTDYATLSYPDL
jgi:hypothetical protein